MNRTKIVLIALLLTASVVNPCFGHRQKLVYRKTPVEVRGTIKPPIPLETKEGTVAGTDLHAITLDRTGSVWVAGSVLWKGLLVRSDGRQISARALPELDRIRDLVFTGLLTGLMISRHNSVYRTNDGGATWQRTLKAESNLTSICFVDAQHGWVAGRNGIILRTTDGGTSWKRQTSGTQYDLKQIQFASHRHGWAIGGKWKGYPLNRWVPVFLTTKDGGNSWKMISASPLPDIVAFVDKQNGWGVDDRDNILHTGDGGESWTVQHKGDQARLFSIYFLNSREGWVGGEELLYTNNGGETWSWINEDFELPGKLDHLVFRDSNEGWGIQEFASEGGPRILHTIDGGKTWTLLPNSWNNEIVEQVSAIQERDAERRKLSKR